MDLEQLFHIIFFTTPLLFFCKMKSSILSYWKAINCKMKIITMSRQKWWHKGWVVKLEGRMKIVYKISRAPIFKLYYIYCYVQWLCWRLFIMEYDWKGVKWKWMKNATKLFFCFFFHYHQISEIQLLKGLLNSKFVEATEMCWW